MTASPLVRRVLSVLAAFAMISLIGACSNNDSVAGGPAGGTEGTC